MVRLFKKYFLKKWWIPTLLYSISVFLFAIYDEAIFLLLIFGLILFTSFIWHLSEAKDMVEGLTILILPVFVIPFFSIVIFFIAMVTVDKPDEELSLNAIKSLIKEETGLIIPREFEVLENLIQHTKGTFVFDSDYMIQVKMTYQESDEKHIITQILKSMTVKSDKGVWKNDKNGFKFDNHDNKNSWNEPYHLQVDTLKNRIDFFLLHL